MEFEEASSLLISKSFIDDFIIFVLFPSLYFMLKLDAVQGINRDLHM